MAQVTYKTIIQNAIKGFNDIQAALYYVGATYDNGIDVPAPSTTTPLSVANILTSDAFREAQFSATSLSQTPVTASIRAYYVDNSTTISLAPSTTAFKLTIGKDQVTSAGSITPQISVTTSGYATSGVTEGSAISFTEADVTSTEFYIPAGTLKVSNGTTTEATATAGLDVTDQTHLAKLKDIQNTGVSYTAPLTGTPGSNYWKVLPIISSSTAGSVSNVSAQVDTEGYVKEGVTSDVTHGAITVNVTPNNGSILYVSRLTTGTLSVSNTPTTDVTVGTTINGGYYPVSVSEISGTWSATKGGYLPINGNVTGTTEDSVTIGRIAAATITSAIGATTVRGFTASPTTTAWSVASTPTVTITNSGYIQQNAGINGSVSTTYLPAAGLHNGFVTSAGMVSVNDEFYITRYNNDCECVEIVFKDSQNIGSTDVATLLAEYY